MGDNCRCISINKTACHLKKRSVFDLIKRSEIGILPNASQSTEDAKGVNGLKMSLKEV